MVVLLPYPTLTLALALALALTLPYPTLSGSQRERCERVAAALFSRVIARATHLDDGAQVRGKGRIRAWAGARAEP